VLEVGGEDFHGLGGGEFGELARRMSSMCSRQLSGEWARAISLGQREDVRGVSARRASMADSNASAVESVFRRRQASEQQRISFQQDSHFFRQVMLRPQEAQVFSGFVERDTERGMRESVGNAQKKYPTPGGCLIVRVLAA